MDLQKYLLKLYLTEFTVFPNIFNLNIKTGLYTNY